MVIATFNYYHCSVMYLNSRFVFRSNNATAKATRYSEATVH